MIEEFTKRWFEKSHAVRTKFEEKFPANYAEIVKAVVEMLQEHDEYECPDPKRIHEIDDGDHQGTLLYVIAQGGYQPSKYWYVKVSYGSCSVCDTLKSLRSEACKWEDDWIDGVDDEQKKKGVDGLMTLALHIVQGLKEMGDE